MNIFRRLGVGALLLVPLAPLAVYLGFLFPYNSGRNFFFRALVLVGLAAWLLLWIRRPVEYRPRHSFLSLAVLAFVAVVSIATALAPYPSLAFWSTLERMDGLVNVLFLVAFFFAALYLLNARRWRIFFHISLGTALVESAVALLQLAGILAIHQGGVRIDATFGNASFFAAYMLLSAGLALFLSVRETLCWRIAYVSCAVLFLFLSLASGTRSAFVALPAALLVSGITALFFSKGQTTPSPLGNPRGISPLIKGERQRGSVPPIGALRKFGVAALAGLALLVGLFFALRQVPYLSAHPLVGRLLSVSLTGSDAQARLVSWGMALRGVAERPLFGWGPEGFRTVFVKYYDPRLGGQEQWFDRAHNTYLDWLVMAGGAGLLAYLALWFGLARAVWRHGAGTFSAWEKVALSSTFAGYAAFNLFSFDTITASIIFLSFLAFVNSRSAEKIITSPQPPFKWGSSENPPLREVSALGGRRMFLASLVCVVAITVFYFTIAKPMLAARYIYLGLQSNSPDLDTRLAYFIHAISLNTFATPEAREMLAQFAVDVAGVPLKDASRKKILTLATQELTRQIEASPDDPRYLLRLGATLNAYRAYADAVPPLEQAVTLSPNKQPSLYELGTSYLNMGKLDEAVKVFKSAADVLPDTEDLESKKLYAVSLVYAHRFSEAEAYMRKIFGETMFPDNRLADAYRRVGQYDKETSIREYLKRLEAVIHSS